jgi:hypothetical protein
MTPRALLDLKVLQLSVAATTSKEAEAEEEDGASLFNYQDKVAPNKTLLARMHRLAVPKLTFKELKHREGDLLCKGTIM